MSVLGHIYMADGTAWDAKLSEINTKYGYPSTAGTTYCGDGYKSISRFPFPISHFMDADDCDFPDWVSWTNDTELLALRTTAIDTIWPSGKPITGATSSGSYSADTYINPSVSYGSITRYVFDMGSSYVNYAYLVTPSVTRNNKLFICQHGHADSYSNNGVDLLAESMLQEGWDILFCYMPLRGPNTGPYVNHNTMIGAIGVTGIKYFVNSLIMALNELTTYDAIAMSGISGGGYTTDLMASLHGGLDFTFSACGSMPLAVWPNIGETTASAGDAEQGYDETVCGSAVYSLFQDFNRFAIYSCASLGRIHHQLLNKEDSCCFSNEMVAIYGPYINTLISSGEFKYLQYAQDSQHTYNQTAIDYILSNI